MLTSSSDAGVRMSMVTGSECTVVIASASSWATTVWRPGVVNVTPWFVKNTCTWLAIDSPGCSSTSGRGPHPIATSSTWSSSPLGDVRRNTRSPSASVSRLVTWRGGVSRVGEHDLGGDVLTDVRLLWHATR